MTALIRWHPPIKYLLVLSSPIYLKNKEEKEGGKKESRKGAQEGHREEWRKQGFEP